MGELNQYDKELYDLAHTYMRGTPPAPLATPEATAARNDSLARIIAGDKAAAGNSDPYVREQALSLRGKMDREPPVIDYATRRDMVRMDGTRKGAATGFYGNIATDGGGMTEVSRGAVGDAGELFGPSMAPGLTQRHLNYIKSSFNGPRNSVMDREIGQNAQSFIASRRAGGESPFFRPGYDLPAKVLSDSEFTHAGILSSIKTGRRW